MVLQMTNEVGKAIFAKAGELGAPVGFMCMKVHRSITLILLILIHKIIPFGCFPEISYGLPH